MTRAACRAVRGAVAALLVLAGTAAAQTPDSLAAPPAADSLGRVAVPPAPPPAATSMTSADSAAAPRRALRRSLLVPGWGQVANGQPAKVPVVAAALGGATAVLVYQQRRYVRYRRSALVAGCLAAPDRDVCADVPDAATEAYVATGSPTLDEAARDRDTARGRRDIAGLGLVAVYALQALDAYVGAQLLGFDVSDDVAVQVVPSGLALRVRL